MNTRIEKIVDKVISEGDSIVEEEYGQIACQARKGV